MKQADFSNNRQAPIVMRYGAFGDMVLLLPMLRYLSQRCGQPVDVISSGGWTRPLMTAQPWVGHLQLVDSRNAPYWLNGSQQEMVKWLRTQSSRPLFICQTDDKARWIASKAGFPDENVYWAKADPFLPGEHWIERWLRVAHQCYGETFQAAGVADYLRSGWLQVDAAAQQDCADWLARQAWGSRPLLLIQAGSKRTMRRGSVDRRSNVKFWPKENWIALGRYLLGEHPDAQLLFCGSPQEHEYAQDLAAGIGDPRAISVADDLPIPRLLALQQRALGMVSVDTGPAHAAAAVGCPLVVLFGDMDPVQWQPYAVQAPVKIVRAASAVDVRSIELEQVQLAWQELAVGFRDAQ